MKKCAESSTSGYQSRCCSATIAGLARVRSFNSPLMPYPGLPSLNPTITGRLQKKREALRLFAVT